MNKHSKRTGYCFVIDDNKSTITILKPKSGEFTQFGKYIVLHETAYGEINLSTLRIEQIAAKYEIDLQDLEDVL